MCRFDALGDPSARGFNVGGGDWPFRGFVVRRGEQIFAYANVCPHQRHPLDFPADRFLIEDGRLIRCASHGALFVAETGLCVAGPCQGRSLMSLGCRIESERVLVRAPASLRDVEPIVDASRSWTLRMRPMAG